MNNKRKSILFRAVLCVLILASLSVSLIGCNIIRDARDLIGALDDLSKTYKSVGDFSIQFNEELSTCSILGISDAGKDKEELIIPKELDGMSVVGIGWFWYSSIISPTLKKLFWAGDQAIYNQIVVNDCPVLDNVIFTSADPTVYEQFFDKTRVYGFGRNTHVILIDEVKQWVIEHSDDYYVSETIINSPSPNVEYYYNYEISPNSGYAWIDYLEYDEQIKTVPQNPTRDGYEFTGWYFDRECNQKADLNNVVKGEENIAFYAGWGKVDTAESA